MNLLDHLVSEHREAESLIDQIADTDPGPERTRLLDELAEALHTHMKVEEQFLYPLAREVLSDDDEVEEGNNEHETAREVLDRMYEIKDEPGFAGALDMLKAGLVHHHGDEEEDLFPVLREKAGDRIDRLDPEKLEEFVGLTREELYDKAQAAGVEGRSDMTRDDLSRALAEDG